MNEFVLIYDSVIESPSPNSKVTTYEQSVVDAEMTSHLSCFLWVDSAVASLNAARRAVLTQQMEVTTERHPGTIPSKHTIAKTSVLSAFTKASKL